MDYEKEMTQFLTMYKMARFSLWVNFSLCTGNCTVFHYMYVSFFIFQTTLISADSINKAIHPSQLTAEFDGTLPYSHEEWIEIRIVSNLYCGYKLHKMLFTLWIVLWILLFVKGHTERNFVCSSFIHA